MPVFGGRGVITIDDKFITAINTLGLTSGLRAVYDAGDADCYPGSGEELFDLTSTNDTFLGDAGTADGDEPTFNGTAGGLSSGEYFSVDGGDDFRFQSKPTWIDPFHKNNAKWTMFWAWYAVSVSQEKGLFGNCQQLDTRSGISVRTQASAPDLTVTVRNSGGAGPALDVDCTDTMSVNAWNICGVSLDEAGGASGSFFKTNSSVDTFNGAYSSPDTGAASDTPEIFSTGGNIRRMQSGARLALFAIWETNLSQGDMEALRVAMAPRFGL